MAKQHTVEGLVVPYKIKRLIEGLDAAARNKAFQGAAHPDDREGIEEAYHSVRFAVAQEFVELLQKVPGDAKKD